MRLLNVGLILIELSKLILMTLPLSAFAYSDFDDSYEADKLQSRIDAIHNKKNQGYGEYYVDSIELKSLKRDLDSQRQKDSMERENQLNQQINSYNQQGQKRRQYESSGGRCGQLKMEINQIQSGPERYPAEISAKRTRLYERNKEFERYCR